MRKIISKYKNKFFFYKKSKTFSLDARELALSSIDMILSREELENFFIAAESLKLKVIHLEWSFFGGYAGSKILKGRRVMARINKNGRITFSLSKTCADLLDLSLDKKVEI